MLCLIIFYLIFFLFLCWRRLDWAIYLIVFALPSYLIRFSVLGLPMTLLEAMILSLFLIFTIKTLMRENTETSPREKLKNTIESVKNFDLKNYLKNTKLKIKNYPAWYYFIVLFLISATIAVFTAPDLRAAAGIWKAYFIEPILFLIVFISTIDKEKLKTAFVFLCASAFIVSGVAIYQKITGDLIANPFWAAAATRRVTGVFPYPNALALYLAPVMTLLLGILMPLIVGIKNSFKNTRHKIQETNNNQYPISNNQNLDFKNWKLKFDYWSLIVYCILFIIYCAVGLAAVYFTRSKGAILGIIAGLLFYACYYQGYRKYFASALGVMLVFIFLYFYIFSVSFPAVLKGSSTVVGGDSITTRINMWQEAWQMLKTKPIVGAGLSGYQTAAVPFHQKDYIEIYLYPHNVFLNFWSELGLLGLISFWLVVGWFYRAGYDKKSRNVNYELRIIIMAAMTGLLVHGLVDVPYFKNDLSVLFWLLVGSMMITNKNSSSIITENPY